MRNLLVIIFLLLAAAPLMAQDKTLKVGVYHNPPKIMFDEYGKLSGIHGELLMVVAERHNWQLLPVECDWEQCLTFLQQGKIDILPDVAKNDARAQWAEFHEEAALLSWSQLYAAKNEKITSLLDLNNKRVAVLKGSVQESYLQQLIESFELKSELYPVESFSEGFDAVLTGKANAVATNQFFGNQQVVDRSVQMTPIMFLPSELFFAVSQQSSSDILTTIDNELKRLKADENSVYYQIIERWSSQQKAVSVPFYVWWIIAALVLLAVGVLFFNQLLRRKVADKTKALAQSKYRLNTILDSVEAYIYIKDKDLRYQYANWQVLKLFKLELEDIIGKTDYDLFDKTTADQLKSYDSKVLESGHRLAQGEVNNLPGEKEIHQFWSVKVPLFDSTNQVIGLCGISTDISEYQNMKEEIQSLAYFDPLTGLANRRFMLERLNEEFDLYQSGGGDGVLVMLDIDHFKKINDSFSHDTGDELLILFGQRLESELRQADNAGRLGSDEFMVLLKSEKGQSLRDDSNLRQRLQVLLERLGEPYKLGGSLESVSVSMGITLFSDAQSPGDLMQAADLALSQAKDVNASKLQFFNTGIQREFNYRQQLIAALRKAIKSESLEIYLQPQYQQLSPDSALNCLGFEALLRWCDEELGWVSPAEFIPLAESQGLMPDLHRLVLDQVLSSIPRLQRSALECGVRVAINVSASQFKAEGFVEDIEQRLLATGIPGELLELEVTESMLIDDIEHTANNMERLKALGVTFALDDFGTGYASLGYLKRLPLNSLKIDQSFIRDLHTNNSDEAIVRTVVALGNSLDLDIIAEGVETEEHLLKLQEMGCFRFQGYYFARPEPVSFWTSSEKD
ncbi:EAL domain-containing protein [Idiomarina abyssalis]|uniref:EAL domain-containing protein n=3 Tax=Idiomarina TaxID=135575 RepID=A0A8I1KI54_9GAMM|nr:EAL domain-containing protein [Idiomarina abyssalis]MBJ7266311.1 EAL domain-containing protein [Idiomarina abyssalis]MBJ7272537.1 EAL domain-containing protein [Idiomarina abyssalis]MBJ7316545.1 EAL domain-containing protein [Idiomarina abyssalis]